MSITDIETAIANRATVRVRILPGNGRKSLNGTVGMAMGYNAQYHTVKFGFVDANGKYTGEKTVISFDYIEIIIETEENSMPIPRDRPTRNRGPLTDLQRDILIRAINGERQKEIAKELGCSEAHVSQENCLAAIKMGVRTSAAAVARYRTYQTYLDAADMIDGGRIPIVLTDADDHVNHVLEGIAQAVRERAERLLPS